RASMLACATNSSTARSSTRSKRPGSSWKAGVGITTPCVRMDRSATSRRRRRSSSRHSRGRPCNPNQRCRPRWRHDHHCTNNQIGPVRGGRSHSDACYVRAYPAAVAEAWVDGHIHAFAFFGAVPQSIVYDNDRCLVAKILPEGTRKRAVLFSGFLSHYLIRDHCGRPGKGNDKRNVEGLVGYCRRNFMVPLPEFTSWEAFNLWLEEQCRKRQHDVLRGESETISERLQRDLVAMRPL